MAIIQAVKDGKLVDSSAEAASESSKSTKKSNNGLDKDAFLQLLVAQMKYQDPLEPTDNTQYISQLATFTQLEETQNMEQTLSRMQANDLVGKQVRLQVTSPATGIASYVTGQVDYVTHEGGKTYLSVNSKLYSLDDLDTVLDTAYSDAVSLAGMFSTAIAALPSKMQLTVADEDKLKNIRAVYDSMTSYQKQFISETDLNKLKELEEQMALLKKNTGETKPDDTDTDNKTDTDDKTDTDADSKTDATGNE